MCRSMASTANILVTPNKFNKLVIPQQRNHFLGHVSYNINRGFQTIFHRERSESTTVRATAVLTEQEQYLEEAKKADRRMLRLVYRVTDLERSIKFYTECLRMRLLHRKDYENYSHAFLGFGSQRYHFAVELVWTDRLGDKLELGNAFNHFGISTRDVFNYVDCIKAHGGSKNITQEPVNVGETYNAFVEDPDGYKFELIQRPSIVDLRLSHLCLKVSDVERSIKFYEKALGMKTLDRVFQDEKTPFSMGMMGYVHDYKTRPYMELLNFAADGPDQYTKGNGFAHLTVGVNDVDNCAAALNLVAKELGGVVNITQQPESASITPWSTSKILFLDPDCWKIVLFDNANL